MTVEELIKELEKMPKELTIEVGSQVNDYGSVKSVVKYKDCIELTVSDDISWLGRRLSKWK